MLIRLIQMHSKIHSKLPSWQVKSKPERGLGSAPGRFRLAAPCFARISQRHLITHRSCHVHKVAAVVAQRRNSNLVLVPSFLPPIRFGVFLRHWPRRFILLTCAIAPGCNCERATGRNAPSPPSSLSIPYFVHFHFP